jgi:hypothetical protein
MNVHNLSISIPPSPFSEFSYEPTPSEYIAHDYHRPSQNAHLGVSFPSDSEKEKEEEKQTPKLRAATEEDANVSLGFGLTTRLDKLSSKIADCEELVRHRRLRDNAALVYDSPTVLLATNSTANAVFDNDNGVREENDMLREENDILKSALVSLRDVTVHEVNQRITLEREVIRLTTRLSQLHHTKRRKISCDVVERPQQNRQNRQNRPQEHQHQLLARTMNYSLRHHHQCADIEEEPSAFIRCSRR